MRTAVDLLLGVAGCFAATVLRAQSGATQQDPNLNNLVHAADYRTATLGSLGGVTRVGSGPVDVVIIPGWGLGLSSWATSSSD